MIIAASVKHFLITHRVGIVRLALILCLFQLWQSVQSVPFARRFEAPANDAGSGMGGGSRLDKVVSDSAGIPEAIPVIHENAQTLESGVLEPELFSRPQTLLYNTYIIQKGDYIGGLAVEFGLNEDTLISVNNIRAARLIQIGQVLRVPNQDGILYTIKDGDTLESLAEKYQIGVDTIQIVNELFSQTIIAGKNLFIPGAKLDWVERQEINGDLFIWPVSGYITSLYGYRKSPFTGVRQFHSGLDIGSPMGTPVRSAMSGRVSVVAWDDVLGNYAVISHHSGYRTLYGHMSVIRVKAGSYVGTGERIGDVGSTGLSTGPHLHFTVYKNGITVNPRSLMK